MKISEVTAEFLCEYVREEPEADVINLLQVIIAAAKAYIIGYTDLTAEQADEHEDLTAAFLVICADMYDVRTYTVNNDKLNPTVKTILGLYAVNYIG